MRTSIPEAYSSSDVLHREQVWGAGVISYLDTSVGRLLYRGQKIVIGGIEGHCESTINNPPIYMDAEVNFHHIARFQNNLLLAGIGGVMRNTIIERESCGKSHSRYQTTALFKARIIQERSHAILDTQGNLSKGLAWPNRLLRVTSDLTMNLSCFAVGPKEVWVFKLSTKLEASFLSSRSSRVINLGVALNFANWVFASGKELGQRNPGRRRLFRSRSLLLFRLLSFLLLGGIG